MVLWASMIQHSRLVDTRLLHQSSRTFSFFNSMFISLSRLWDEIPSNLHTITNLSSFKSGCKKHFMSLLDWVPYCMFLFDSELLACLCFDYPMYESFSIIIIIIIITVICFQLDKRTPRWLASSPFSYPELLAYLLFVYHIMLCTFIYCDFFVFAITVDNLYF